MNVVVIGTGLAGLTATALLSKAGHAVTALEQHEQIGGVTASLERDGYRCQFPGCTRRRGLEVHHIRYRSAGGGDDEGNKVTLCHVHHRRVIHEGYARLWGTAPQGLRWEIGLLPGRQPWVRLTGERVLHSLSIAGGLS